MLQVIYQALLFELVSHNSEIFLIKWLFFWRSIGQLRIAFGVVGEYSRVGAAGEY